MRLKTVVVPHNVTLLISLDKHSRVELRSSSRENVSSLTTFFIGACLLDWGWYKRRLFLIQKPHFLSDRTTTFTITLRVRPAFVARCDVVHDLFRELQC